MGKTTQKSAVIDAVLDLLALGVIVSTTLVAPNVAQVFGKMYNKRSDRRTQEREARALLHYMKRQGIVQIVEADGEYRLDITQKGRSRLVRRQLDTLSIPAPTRWDGKWRIVMFDIPQRHDLARRALTARLQMLGFVLLQRSVWVHPFPFFDEIEVIKDAFPEITPYILVAEADRLNVHSKLLKIFESLLSA